ncbi:MAG: FAD-dependent oxidoreductase, partial [Pseudomonadota bacterium]|nr:FAD-dependent oxidoreductase [Pseudomonadota bacterium]
MLVGAGHAHLHIAARAQAYRDVGARLLLIDPGEFWYSGMATGLLGGEFEPDEDRIDPHALMQASGGAFIRDAVSRICPDTRRITLASGRTLDYDWLSLNVGSEVDTQSLPTAENGPQIWPVKPIPPLYTLRLSLEAAMRDQGAMPPVVIIGGGATGSELAANLAGLARRCDVAPQVTLVSRASRLLTSAPARAARRLHAAVDVSPVARRVSAAARRHTNTGGELASGGGV